MGEILLIIHIVLCFFILLKAFFMPCTLFVWLHSSKGENFYCAELKVEVEVYGAR